jgi:hypothetical protein
VEEYQAHTLASMLGEAGRRSKSNIRVYLALWGGNIQEPTLRLRGRSAKLVILDEFGQADQSYKVVHLNNKCSHNGKPKDPRNNNYRSGSKKGR